MSNLTFKSGYNVNFMDDSTEILGVIASVDYSNELLFVDIDYRRRVIIKFSEVVGINGYSITIPSPEQDKYTSTDRGYKHITGFRSPDQMNDYVNNTVTMEDF